MRARPGDAIIIGGIVQERDDIEQEGLPGISKPSLTTLKTKTAQNSELVFMLRPRVVVYTENPPDGAMLLQGGIKAEPSRVQNTPAVLPREAPVQPAAANSLSMSNYLEKLPVDQIAPSP
jgi:type II secretory pathway component GspD/PulD (secretin)